MHSMCFCSSVEHVVARFGLLKAADLSKGRALSLCGLVQEWVSVLYLRAHDTLHEAVVKFL